MTPQRPPQQTWWAERATVLRRYDEMESRLTASVSERMLDLACLRPGMRVLDVASGMGEPSLRAARRVGPSGFVLGTDLSGGMLEAAREKARAQALSNIEFRVADAETLEVPEQSFDAATVRWGLMYMPRPERALERLWRALRPSGRLVCACWAGPGQVEYASLPRRSLARFRQLPPVEPEAPGVFRFSDPEHLRPLLTRSGFAMEHVESILARRGDVARRGEEVSAAMWRHSGDEPMPTREERIPYEFHPPAQIPESALSEFTPPPGRGHGGGGGEVTDVLPALSGRLSGALQQEVDHLGPVLPE